MLKKLVLAAVVLVVVGAVAGFALGQRSAEPEWLEGEAQVSVEGRVVSIEVDDWTYGFRGPVPWYDREGTFHSGSWPACLRDYTGTVRFLALRRDIDLIGKPVLAVDCRETS